MRAQSRRDWVSVFPDCPIGRWIAVVFPCHRGFPAGKISMNGANSTRAGLNLRPLSLCFVPMANLRIARCGNLVATRAPRLPRNSKFDRLRYQLLPYIYSLAGNVTQQGGTLMRALVMDFPTDTNVFNIGDEYMFGPALLINPVTTYQARSRSGLFAANGRRMV